MKSPKVGIVERHESQVVHMGNGCDLAIRERWRLSTIYQTSALFGVPFRRRPVVIEDRYRWENHFIEILNDHVTATRGWKPLCSEPQFMPDH